ncbi:MAG: Hpt domain-containing protein [Caldilineaceae bacterium]|nr:Hpt domain-containing protein [Caldilineaceae bacterium]MBP8107450.1 Hpt domain-containing protein [Caldilineaceae bacterium]MBP8122401.1 Hpt domain-containing protein [Caldilineaceae bacterium]MBP9073549.1 Hpt domain-containing protein [Caldilineaceae bacterium]
MTSPTSSQSSLPQILPGPPHPLRQAALDDLRELTDNNDDLFFQLVETYLDSASTLLGTLPDAAARDDAAKARAAAHDIKSMSAMFGAMELSELARELEQRGIDGVIEGMADLVAQMLAEFEQVSATLTAMITPSEG